MDLDQKGNIMAEYVWIDASSGLRSKSKVRTTLFPQMLRLPRVFRRGLGEDGYRRMTSSVFSAWWSHRCSSPLHPAFLCFYFLIAAPRDSAYIKPLENLWLGGIATFCTIASRFMFPTILALPAA
jgi:hypothetical protein